MENAILIRLQRDPAEFRRRLIIDVDGEPTRFADVMDGWQDEDFRALDRGWQRVAGVEVDGGYRRAYLERPRGHSKTFDIAAMVCWVLFASCRKISGYAAAGDIDQAKLLRDAMDTLVRLNPWLGEILIVRSDWVENRRTGSKLTILTSDAPTSYGLTPDFIVCDEVTNWVKRDLWDSLFSAAAKRSHCLPLVIANAGFEDSWVWESREIVRTDPDWYFRRLDGPRATWITPDRLAEQRRHLPDVAYRRLWLNEWAPAGGGDCFDAADIDACCTLSGPVQRGELGFNHPHPRARPGDTQRQFCGRYSRAPLRLSGARPARSSQADDSLGRDPARPRPSPSRPRPYRTTGTPGDHAACRADRPDATREMQGLETFSRPESVSRPSQRLGP